ncbi:conserved hypothetical protein [uncultured Gammaproteobacteria bacterium]
MPQAIDHIDKIARDLQRDVLYIVFTVDSAPKGRSIDFLDEWHSLPIREQIISWLDTNNIKWRMCGPIASECGWRAYEGQIYIDIPVDATNQSYHSLINYMEHEDGRVRWPHVIFYQLPLAVAMKNAHHDEPGFWEHWAENF